MLCSVGQINIVNFHASELLVWTKLEHLDVVCLYGAAIYQDSVYIFQELIVGLLHSFLH